MTTEDFKTGVQRAVKMEDVPREKFGAMVKRTILGGLFVVLGILSATTFQWGAFYSVGLLVFGASLWSTQLVTHALLAMATPLRELRRAWKGDA
jgi:hypothetical protein